MQQQIRVTNIWNLIGPPNS